MPTPEPPRTRIVLDEFALRGALSLGEPFAAVDARAARHWIADERTWEFVLPADGGARAAVWVLPASMRSAPGRPARFALRGEGVEVHLFVDGSEPAVRAFVDGRPADEVWIQGPRLDGTLETRRPPRLPTPEASDRTSRYAGALGGARVLDRLRSLSIAVVGVSRLGSRFALLAARSGVGSLVLVDPDHVEPHNLDQMIAGDADLGRPKVEAVADALRRDAPGVDVVTVPTPLESAEALDALKRARVVVTAPDRNEPRVFAAAFCSAYRRIHLDLGTQVVNASPASFAAGLDVRLVLPGEACLLCVGGVDLDRMGDTSDGLRARAGSLASLNGLAVSQGWLLVERLVAGSLRRSAWVRLEVDAEGMPTTRLPVFRPRGADCPVCGRADPMAAFDAHLSPR